MSSSEAPPKGKHQKHPHRKRTMFTEKQLEDLTLLFNRNPYPDPSLKREMASKMNLDPMVLQVWFKNHRAKLKKAKRTVQQKQEAPEEPQEEPRFAERAARARAAQARPEPAAQARPEPTPQARPVWSSAASGLRAPGAGLAAAIYTNRQTPSFQLRICAPFKVHTGHAGCHSIVHFGCCRDPTVYCLHPVADAPGCSPRCAPAHLHPAVPGSE